MIGSVAAIAGLDTHPTFRPLHVTAPQAMRMAPHTAPLAATGNDPGFWTVADFARLYDVQPLYQGGVTGRAARWGSLRWQALHPAMRSRIGKRWDLLSIQVVFKL